MKRSSLLLPLLVLSLATLPAPATGAPRLVLVLAVDQLRPDGLDAALPGGLGRLAREGRVYTEAALAHGMTETCPGHAALLTGRHPARNGLPGNGFLAEDGTYSRYCVDDPAADAVVLGGAEGRSPRNLRTDTLGDWMKAADPRTRVFSVSGKDRSAITLGGHGADAVYWYRRDAPPRFTTSRYYAAALPDWVEAWNGSNPPADGFLATLPERWEHAPPPGAVREDDFVGESTAFLRVSGHPVRDDDAEATGERLYATPYLDELTIAFTRRLVEVEDVGRGPAPDLLALALSGTDIVGHAYGPFSHESADALRRLDASLGELLTFLETRVGPGGLVVALSSDHGVLPLPEWLEREGAATCPVPGGRVGVRSFGMRLLAHLHLELSPLSWPRAWVSFAGAQVGVNRELARERGVPVERVAGLAEAWLEAQPVVARAWTPEEIAEDPGELGALYRNSYVAGRSGDLIVQAERGCLISPHDTGTSHGSPYDYDRRVPLSFWGPGIAPGAVAGPAASVDLGPSLGAYLGLVLPPDLDGRALVPARAAREEAP